jgi:GntR family transcriptional repressor for pyruvate dehydrogenase complex
MNPLPTSTPSTSLGHSEASALIVRLLPFISERRLEPGDRLPSERLLAERFGVTRAIVREALAKLEAMRVVECRPRSGVYLTAESQVGSLDAIVMKADLGLPFDESEADHLNEFRSILESQAIELACARRTQQDVDRLDQCMAECRDRFERGESIAQPSADFHLAIIAATHNQFLLRAANSCYLATREMRERVFADRKVCSRSIRDHQAIRDAIAQGSVTRARTALKAHLHIAGHYWHEKVVSDGAAASKTVAPAANRRRRGPMTPQSLKERHGTR